MKKDAKDQDERGSLAAITNYPLTIKIMENLENFPETGVENLKISDEQITNSSPADDVRYSTQAEKDVKFEIEKDPKESHSSHLEGSTSITSGITNENDAGGNNDTEEKRPKRKIYRKKMPVEMVRRFRNLYQIATIENIIDELLDSLLLTL